MVSALGSFVCQKENKLWDPSAWKNSLTNCFPQLRAPHNPLQQTKQALPRTSTLVYLFFNTKFHSQRTMWWSLVQRSSISWTFAFCCPPPSLARQPCSTPNPLRAHYASVWHNNATMAWIVLKYSCDEANNLKLAEKPQISQATQGTTNPTLHSTLGFIVTKIQI